MVLLISGIVKPCIGQNEFKGRITDINTGEGIINATIIFGDGKGAISDSQGSFVIENPVFPLKLTVSNLNYQQQTVIVRSIVESGLTIQLQSKQVDIDQVEILGERLVRFLQRKYFYIVDYAFLDDNIALIGFDKSRLSRGQLVLTDLNQDTLSKIPIKKPKSLFKDAFGNLHLFAGDSVYQVIFLNNRLELIYPAHQSDFLRVLQLQIAEDHSFVFKDIYGDGQLHVYYRIDTLKNNVDTLISIYNHELFAHEDLADRYKKRKLRKLTIDYKGQMDSSAAGVRAANQLFTSTHYDNLIIHKPITSQIFKYGNEYIILDIANSEIHAFTKDSLKERSVKMDIPAHSQRVKYFIQDEITGKIYWINFKGTQASLLELDIYTGKIIGSLQTPNLPLIENVRIRKGEIWFLYQPRLGETVRSLFRMK